MSASVYLWVLPAHVIGLFLWLGGMFTVYWLLRVHATAPKEMHERLILMERSLAMMMDIASALAIGTGLALALAHPAGNLFGLPKQAWLHVKLTIVVLGILSVHGMVRARIKKFSQGNLSDVPQWQWSLLLVSIVAIVILVERRPF
jgi:uncharacterized membrane protein